MMTENCKSNLFLPKLATTTTVAATILSERMFRQWKNKMKLAKFLAPV